MHLALAAGNLNVNEVLDNMSSEQFSEWQAFARIYPFGPSAETERFAIQQANTLNAPHFSTKKVRLATEFIPTFKPKKKTVKQQIAMFNRLG